MTDGHQTASGMIGLGNMGGRIARRIRDAGLPITGYDRSESQAAQSGIDPAASIAELAAEAEIIFLSLPDSSVVEAVVFGDGGLIECAREGQVVVDLSTAAPSSTQKICAALGARGVAFVDAGISGGAAAAEKGTLAIMAGGSQEALERARPQLETFSAHVYHMGDSGSGHVAKLLNNFLNAISLAATAEVMVAAKQADLDLAQFLDVVNHSSGVNFATTNRFPRIIEGDYLEGGLTSALMAKDVRLYLEYLQQIEVTSFTGAACLGAFNLAAALGYGDQISNRVVDAIGDIAGGVRIQQSEEAPIVRIAKGGRTGQPSEERGATFTGRVWADPVLGAEDGIMINNVFFEPGARTHWHTHGYAQVLQVIAGEGRVQSRDGTGSALQAGDTVHIPAGEEHWHGAAPGSYLLHLAVSVGGTDWLDPVSDDDYAGATAS